jgi:hypothetical protein
MSDAAYPVSGGCFSSAGSALAFLGAAIGARLAAQATCRHGGADDWWIEMPSPWQAVAPLVWTAGGRPFAGDGRHWFAVAPSGRVQATADGLPDPTGWRTVAWSELLAAAPLPLQRPAAAASVEALVPGVLGRWVLRRALARGLEVGVTPALQQPLRGTGPESGLLRLRLQARQGAVPLSLLQAVTRLPYTVVARSVGLERGRLLVDVRCRPPLAVNLLAGLVPAAETWVLAGPDLGHRRLRNCGEESDGAGLMTMPDLPITVFDAGPPPALPAPLPVRLVRAASAGRRVDAVLLDEIELQRLPLFLTGRPLSERAFLLPGAGRWLLLAPGGLPGVLPFGIPLTRIGPGGLYLEAGLDFHPPLPEAARIRAFRLAEERAVAVTADGAYGFTTAHLLPVWSLWLGEAPPVQEGLSPAGRRLLAQVSAAIRTAEVERPTAETPVERPLCPPVGDRSRLLEEAQRAELAGDLVRAAEWLEAAGELVTAARLYERAAAQALR